MPNPGRRRWTADEISEPEEPGPETSGSADRRATRQESFGDRDKGARAEALLESASANSRRARPFRRRPWTSRF
jgi:hypothetical protein